MLIGPGWPRQAFKCFGQGQYSRMSLILGTKPAQLPKLRTSRDYPSSWAVLAYFDSPNFNHVN